MNIKRKGEIMSNIIFYFSGTGNCLAAAYSIAEKLGDTKLVSILALNDKKEIPENYERIGFIYPTVYSHAPKMIMNAVNDLELHPNQKIFLIATCGGGCGFALKDMREKLQSITKNPIQEFCLRLPGNHIIGFSAYSESSQQKIFKKAEKTIDEINYKIQNDFPTKPLRTPPFPKLHIFIQKTLNEKVLKVPDIYETDVEFYTTNDCELCGTCEKLCLANNIKVSSNEVSFGDNCQQCMACIQWCPKRAIYHPNVTEKKKRYHHPDITIDDMLKAKGEHAHFD